MNGVHDERHPEEISGRASVHAAGSGPPKVGIPACCPYHEGAVRQRMPGGFGVAPRAFDDEAEIEGPLLEQVAVQIEIRDRAEPYVPDRESVGRQVLGIVRASEFAGTIARPPDRPDQLPRGREDRKLPVSR